MRKFLLLVSLTSFGCLTEFEPASDTCFDFVEVIPREPGRVQYTVPVVDFDTQLTAPIPVPGVTVQVCTNATCIPELPLCDGEVGNCWREFPGPSPAVRVFDFPFGLNNAVMRFAAPGYIPTDYVLGGPMIGSPEGDLALRGVGIVLVKQETYTALHDQVGAAPDPSRGTLGIRVLDCALQRSAGQTLEAWNANLDGATGFSLSSGNLVTDSRMTTDQRGVVGFFNLPTQTLDVWVPAWSNPVTYNIRPGTLTLAELRWGLEQFGQ